MKSSSPETTRWIGRAGTVDWMPVPDDPSWRGNATIDSWLCNCPGQSPAWQFYVLAAVHLRDLEGQDQPPQLRTPDASHEIIMLALNPEKTKDPKHTMFVDGSTFDYMVPMNISMQIEDCTDEQCRELLVLLAKGIAHGFLPAEPPFPNPEHEATWEPTIATTLEHIKLGGHPQGSA